MELDTIRLKIIPLDPKNLELSINNYSSMEQNLGLTITNKKPGEKMKKVLNLRLSKVNDDLVNFFWNTVWLIVFKDENCIIGSVMLKGCPDEKGEVIIGYSINEPYRTRNYMTEALTGMTDWIFKNPNVNSIIADTLKDNIPSQRVLQKIGMIMYDEDNECFWWKINRNMWH